MNLLIQFRRQLARLLLLIFIHSTFSPSISYALTAGPTAPEATSFEPVDTTDLVDLKTGDFTYNLPLLEVPGPAGSYPLTLGYHAGILPNQEATWTGLGFNLNTGSISRLVNGYPDDHYDVTDAERTFWEGGHTTAYTVGVSVGIANAASVSAGLTFANDTYRGRGVGGYVGAGVGYRLGVANLGISGNVGLSPYGGTYYSMGLGVGISKATSQATSASVSGGVYLNSGGKLNAGAGVGVSAGSTSVIGASISSSGTKPQLSVGGGAAGVYNSRAGAVSTSSSNFQVDIPIYYGVSLRLGRDYQRYWIDEMQGVHTFGALYMQHGQPGDAAAFDTYDLLDTDLDVALFNDPEKVLGGSLPDDDVYTVAAQGLSGNIRPYHFQQHLFRQDKRDDAHDNILTKSYQLGSVPDKPVEFRFVNDFSNRMTYAPKSFNNEDGTLKFDFEGDVITGEKGNDGFSNNQLAGSKHISWYTNQEITRASKDVDPFREGFVDCVAEGFSRFGDQQIGGFSITNASGVTYHFALPAYTFDEYMKTINSASKQKKDGVTYNELVKPGKYAYTWFLTTVTGPDFVDRNDNGRADQGDWGYWVNFEYKKYLDDYCWRNPAIGTNRDVDGNFEFYASGKKEIYYLDKITTDSHVAVFEKSTRYDGREVTDRRDTGGFESTTSLPRPALKLDRIKLFNYDDFMAGRTGDDFQLRSVEFHYDYTLAQGTPNSLKDAGGGDLGKLTLESVLFKGKGGASLIPPVAFDYKNKPYADKTDVWGFYKDDFDETFRDRTNNIIGRKTTKASAADVDAWSLTSIKTSLGSSITIDYESDQYEDVALGKQQIMQIRSVEDAGPGKLKIGFWETLALSDFYQENQQIDIDLVGSFVKEDYTGYVCDCMPAHTNFRYLSKIFSGNVRIDKIDDAGNTLLVSGDDYYNLLKNGKQKISILGDAEDTGCRITPCYFTYDGSQSWPDYFPAGVVSSVEGNKFGGGVRVKSISINKPSGGSRSTEYSYFGGVTSYEPYEIMAPKIVREFYDLLKQDEIADISRYYTRMVMDKHVKSLAMARQIPGPGVMYPKVIVQEKNTTPDGVTHRLPNYTVYEFETFRPDMLDVHRKSLGRNPATFKAGELALNDVVANNVVLKDYTARVGSLKAVTLFNAENDKPISETLFHYLHDGPNKTTLDNRAFETQLAMQFDNQGVVEEAFTRSRIIHFSPGDWKPYYGIGSQPAYEDNWDLFASIIQYESFPSVPTGETQTNYKTDVSQSTTTVAFDFYSGEPTEILTGDSYGNQYLTKKIAAYRNYSGMGLKIDDRQNKNMLTQPGEAYTFLVNGKKEPQSVLAGSVQTWSDYIPTLEANTPRLWRMKANWEWHGKTVNDEGASPYNEFQAFNWDNPSSVKGWQNTLEFTLYDSYSHVLEAKDINGNYAATRMSPGQQKVIAMASPSAYYEMAYSGAEYYHGNSVPEGGVDRGEGNPSVAHAHTGDYSLLVASGKTGFHYASDRLIPMKHYSASVWVYAPGEAETQGDLDKVTLYYTQNGRERASVHPVLQKNKSKNWYLLVLDILPNEPGEISIGVKNNAQRGVYLDDFRVHPAQSSFSAYVYDSFSGELSYLLDDNNLYTAFEYDGAGRLIRTRREMLNYDFGDGKESVRPDVVTSETQYNFGKKN